MTNFKSFIDKYNITTKELSCTKEYQTYRKWLSGKTTDPQASSLKIFMNQFGHRFNYDAMELLNCFPLAYVESPYTIINISSNHLPRRNIFTILNLFMSHYEGKRVLVINSTPYYDFEKILKVTDNLSLEDKLNGISLPSISTLNLCDYIFPTSCREIDILRISPCDIGPLLAETEDDIVNELRKKIIDLDTYDYFIINTSMSPIHTSRILGKLSNIIITFDDNISMSSRDHFSKISGIKSGRDELAIIPVPPNSYFNLEYIFDSTEGSESEALTSIPVKDTDNIHYDDSCLNTVASYLSNLIADRLK